MKFKTTRTEMYNNYGAENIIRIGYCDLQSLLNYEHASAYTCGVYGWNSDIYELPHGVIISTGYRPIGTKRLDYDFIKAYEKKAQDILYSTNWDHQKEKLDNLVEQFTREVREKC